MRRFLPLLTVFVLAATACGDDDSGSTTSRPEPSATTTTASPVTTAAPPTSTIPAETTTTTATSASDAVSVTFDAEGVTLDATVFPGGEDWIVLGHMLPADKSSWSTIAGLFQDAGYTVLAYNNRGYGDSEGDREPFALDVDAAAAITYASTEGATRIAYGGASMNGATAMTLGPSGDVAAIFALSGVRTFNSVGNASGYLPDTTVAALFVGAEDDGNAANDALFYAEEAPNGEAIVLASGGHGTDMLFTNPALAGRIVDWLTEALSSS